MNPTLDQDSLRRTRELTPLAIIIQCYDGFVYRSHDTFFKTELFFFLFIRTSRLVLIFSYDLNNFSRRDHFASCRDFGDALLRYVVMRHAAICMDLGVMKPTPMNAEVISHPMKVLD